MRVLVLLLLLPSLVFAAPLTVSYGNGPKQAMDVYIPPKTKRAPIILFVHPGGWQIGDKEADDTVKYKAPFFTGKGFLFISANHRLMPNATPLEQARDIGHALAYVQMHAGEWGGDPRKVILMGHSSGAHLVSLLAASPTLLKAQGAAPVLGVVSLENAGLRVDKIMEVPRMWFYNSVFKDDRALWHAVSPYDQLEKGAPPFLLVCSTAWHSSCRHAQEFADKAKKMGVRVTVFQTNENHSMAGYAVGLNNPKFSPISNAVQAFIDGVLR